MGKVRLLSTISISYALLCSFCQHRDTILVTDILEDRIFRDVLATIEVDDCIIHEHHTFLFRDFENRIHVMRLTTDDEISDRVIVEHDFSSNDSS